MPTGLTYLVAYVLRVATEVIELSFYGGDPNVTMLIALDSRCIAETWVTGQWSECSGVEHVEPKIGAHPKTLCGIFENLSHKLLGMCLCRKIKICR